MSEKPEQPTSDSTAQRPGPLLKQARERLNLSQKEVAMQLNLQVEVIDAIEADRSEQFPAATYARGYIRSYARVVGLNGDEMVRLFDSEPVTPPEIIPDIKSSRQASSHDKPVRAVTYLVTFLLAILLLAWVQSNYVVDGNKDAETEAADSAVGGYPDAQTPAKPAPEQDYGQTYTERPTEEQMSQLQINEGTSFPPAHEDIIHNMKLSGIDGFVEAVEPPVMDSGAITEPGTTAAFPDDTTGDRLILKLSADSWIEVHDADDQRLYLGLGKAGEVINLTGTAPFSVLLGYSPAVEVTFNGSPYNPEPHSNAGVAQFTLGEAGPDNP